MPGGLGPRFALEAGFLILLAAVAAYARLSTAEIIAVMAGGWLLTAIFEVIAATRERFYLRTRWQPRVEETPAEAEPEPKPRRSWFRRAPAVQTETKAEVEAEARREVEPEAPPPPAPATEDVAPAAEAPAPATEAPAPATEGPVPAVEAPVPKVEAPEPPVEAPASTPTPASTDEDTGEFELPAPEPRRWFRRKRAEPPPLTEADVEPARPSARHVRLIRGNNPDATEGETPPSEAADEERKDADSAS
jgi:hypothetical protein